MLRFFFNFNIGTQLKVIDVLDLTHSQVDLFVNLHRE